MESWNISFRSGPRVHDFAMLIVSTGWKNGFGRKGFNQPDALPFCLSRPFRFSRTEYYLRLTADLYPDIISKLEKSHGYIIPESGVNIPWKSRRTILPDIFHPFFPNICQDNWTQVPIRWLHTGILSNSFFVSASRRKDISPKASAWNHYQRINWRILELAGKWSSVLHRDKKSAFGSYPCIL